MTLRLLLDSLSRAVLLRKKGEAEDIAALARAVLSGCCEHVGMAHTGTGIGPCCLHGTHGRSIGYIQTALGGNGETLAPWIKRMYGKRLSPSSGESVGSGSPGDDR